jgi:hypothetical protein
MVGRRCLSSAGVAAAFLLVAGPVRAEPYKDAAHKFALDVPDGWEVVPAKELAALNAAARRADPRDSLTRVAAFRPAGTGKSPTPWKHPRVTVASIPFHEPDATFKDFEKVLTRVFTMRNAYGQTNLRAPLAFDESKKRLIVQCNNDDGQAEYAAGFIGEKEIIIVSGLVERKAYKEHLPTFEKVVESYRFEDPSAAPPGGESPYLDRVLGTKLGRNGQTAAIGVGVAVVVLLVGSVFLKEKPGRHGHGM